MASKVDDSSKAASADVQEVANPQEAQDASAIPSQPVANAAGSSSLVGTVIANWNAREWAQAAEGLDQILATDHAGVDKRMVAHLTGICASFRGKYTDAKKIFEAELSNLPFQDEDYIPDALEISAAHWLGDTCLILRQMDDAALAWSIAADGISAHEAKFSAESTQLFKGLYFLQDGSLQGDVLSRRALDELSNALANGEKTTVKIFRLMSNQRKADYIGSAVEPVLAMQKPDTKIPAFEERASELLLDTEDFRYSIDKPTIGKFQYDTFLMLDPKKYQHVAAWGLDVNYAQLDLRFWPNLHQEYQFFSKIPVTSIYSTRKRSLKWIVSSLESELNTRGLLCCHYFDRIKVIRVREFGLMDYVAAFTIIFIRTPLYTVFGVQVPNHLVRTGWGAVHGPEIKARNRVVREVKEILAAAELRDPEDDPQYRDIIVGSQQRPTGPQQSGTNGAELDSRQAQKASQQIAVS